MLFLSLLSALSLLLLFSDTVAAATVLTHPAAAATASPTEAIWASRTGVSCNDLGLDSSAKAKPWLVVFGVRRQRQPSRRGTARGFCAASYVCCVSLCQLPMVYKRSCRFRVDIS